jgi:3-dehydroquinate synthase
MSTIEVRVKGHSYPVIIQDGVVARLGSVIRDHLKADRVVAIVDRNVASHHGRILRRGLKQDGVRVLLWVEVPSGERSKSLSRARTVYQELVEAGADRWTPIVAIGGGVVGDLAGFVASTFMRGVPLVHVPTTVVAQVDSSVGGKTAVNFSRAKNVIGTFYQPELVLSDPGLLSTLSARDYRAGLVEAVKVGITLRPDLLEKMEEGVDLLEARDPGILQQTVTACVGAKGEVVSRDEKDRDVRAILNYGHTIGHAVEAASLGRLRHGEAIAVGMNAAAWVGERIGVSSPEVRRRQNDLLQRLGLKLTLPGADKRVIVRNLKLDKKLRSGNNRFVLTMQCGGASVWPHISGRILRDAVRFVTS